MAHNKYLIPLLHLLINCISAKSTPKIFFKRTINSSFLKFSNNWFMKLICELLILDKIYTTASMFFYQKTCILLKLILFANSHILDYLQSRKLCLLKPYLTVFFYSNLYIYHKPYHVESRLYQDHFCKYNMYFRIRIITLHFANCKVNSNCSDCIVVNHTKMVKQFFPKGKFNLSNYIFPHNILN